MQWYWEFYSLDFDEVSDQNICENSKPCQKNHPKFLPIVHQLLLKIFKQFKTNEILWDF